MDIRKYFSPVNQKKPVPEPKKEKKRKYVIESDDEDPIPSYNKKKNVVVSDSDDDIFEIPTTSKSKASKSSQKEIKLPSKDKTSSESNQSQKEAPKLKKVTPTDFFGSAPVSQSRKGAQKRKVEDAPPRLQNDEDFEKTLRQLDELDNSKNKKVEEAKLRPNENSPPNKLVNGSNKGLASKLSDKMKGERKDASSLAVKNCIEDKERKKMETPEKIEREKFVKSPVLGTSQVKENKGKTKPPKNVKSKLYEMDVTLNKSEEKPPKQSSSSPAKVKEEQSSRSAHKRKAADESSTPDIDEQKKQRALAYRKFLNRTGPRNPGGKPLPEGKSNCLANLTFVITGMLETIDRDETTELIKKYGGRVTSSISKLTSFLVVGDDPGQTKIKKAEQLGTKTLNEDELFELIEKSKPQKDSSTDSLHEEKSQTPTQSKKSGLSKLEEFQREKKKPSDHALPSSQISKSSKGESPGTSSLSSLGSPSSTKSLSQKTESLSSQELASKPTDTLMWVDKYKPTSMKNIIGQQGEQSNAKKLLNWLRNWSSNQNGSKKLVRPSPWAKDNSGAFFKAALLSGPPGVGKTTTAHLVSRELSFDVVEMNASDTRSKRTLHEEVTDLLRNKSLSGFAGGNREKSLSSNHVLLMDEVDGMAGNEDRGGVQELIALIKSSRVPIVCMCNDRNHPKIRSLANHCFDLRFQKPRLEQIKGAMMSVCFREGIKIRPEALDQMILGSNQDVRQVLHHLSMWSADQKTLDTDAVKKDAQLAKKEFKMGPWDVCTSVFSESAHKSMSIHDRVSLFFHDYSIGPLFVQENYLKVSPHCAKGNRKKLLEQISKTASVLADSDIIDRAIRMESAWSLLPTQAIMSSVCPGEYMAGHFSAQVEFPRWLGNNSRRNKFDRLAQELHTHMRLKMSGSKQDIVTDYCSRLRDCIVEPLVKQGSDGVRESVDAMIANDLVREDLDSILELSAWPGMKDKMASVESKVKAAFTRTLNKESLPTSFGTSVVKKSRGAALDEYGLEEEEDEASEEEEEEEEISKDSKIKVGKTSQKETAKGKGKGKGKQSKGSKK